MDYYKKMYAILCWAASEALSALPASPEVLRSRLLLEKGLLDAEELYLSASGNSETEKDQ